MKNSLAIIPARGGSKGVPKKNICNINNLPLISYSIALCKLSNQINHTIVSTDDSEIAEVAKKFGGNVPFLRPKEISGDNSHDRDYLIHAKEWCEKSLKFSPENFIIIRPTTPLREPDIIDEAIIKFHANPSATSLVSVHECPEPPAKMFGLEGEYLHGLAPFDPRKEYFALPRQHFPPAYIGNGYIDIIKSDFIEDENRFYGDKILSFITPDYGEIDIQSDIKKIEYYANTRKFRIFEYLQKY